MRLYEAMFLVPTGVATDWEAVEAEIGRLMERAGSELLVCRRWDERRLAYPIKGHKRGCYILTYFRADPGRIAELERSARLSERILRALVLRADQVSEEQIRKQAKQAAAERAVRVGRAKAKSSAGGREPAGKADQAAESAEPSEQAGQPREGGPGKAEAGAGEAVESDAAAPAAPEADRQGSDWR